jgi:hypothetical protein
MSAPSASTEGDGDQDLLLSRSEASGGVVGLPVPPRMLLTDGQWRTEHTLLALLAVEHIRVVEPADSGATTSYVNGVADNARLLAGANGRLYVTLLRSQLKWLRRLPSGVGELR